MEALKTKVIVGDGGLIQFQAPNLVAGREVEITVSLPDDEILPAELEEDTDDEPIWEAFERLRKDVPLEEFAKLPKDLAAEHDHYLYGTPKKYS